MQCSAIKKDGTRCGSTIIVKGTDPPLCHLHTKTGEERREHSHLMHEARHGKPSPEPAEERDEQHGVPQPKSLLEQVREVLAKQREERERVHTEPEYALTPDHTRTINRDRWPIEVYRDARQKWITEHLVYSRSRGLYIEPLPDYVIAPSESREHIEATELPDLTGWDVMVFVSGNAAQATRPDGQQILLRVDP